MNYSVFTSHYFTDWILTATTLVSLVVSWNHRAHKQLSPIRIYIAASLFIDILFTLTELLFGDEKLWLEINCLSFNLYTILELSIIFLFIKRIIIKKNNRNAMKVLYGIYLSFCIATWLYFPNAIISNFPHLFALEGIIITSFCLLYFHELIHSIPKNEIWNRPEFWVISGTLLYFSTTSPFYILFKGLYYDPFISVIFTCVNYGLCTILFLAFIKAYLCPIPIQK